MPSPILRIYVLPKVCRMSPQNLSHHQSLPVAFENQHLQFSNQQCSPHMDVTPTHCGLNDKATDPWQPLGSKVRVFLLSFPCLSVFSVECNVERMTRKEINLYQQLPLSKTLKLWCTCTLCGCIHVHTYSINTHPSIHRICCMQLNYRNGTGRISLQDLELQVQLWLSRPLPKEQEQNQHSADWTWRCTWCLWFTRPAFFTTIKLYPGNPQLRIDTLLLFNTSISSMCTFLDQATPLRLISGMFIPSYFLATSPISEIWPFYKEYSPSWPSGFPSSCNQSHGISVF